MTVPRGFSGGQPPEAQSEFGDGGLGVGIAPVMVLVEGLDTRARPWLEPPRLAGEQPQGDSEFVRLLASVIESYAPLEGLGGTTGLQGRIDKLLEQLNNRA